MNEELKVKISAEIASFTSAMEQAISALQKLKKATDETGKATDDTEKKIKSFGDRVKEASKNVEKNFKKAGQAMGTAFKTGAKVAAAGIGSVATAVTGFVAGSIKSFAEYQQLAGGVEKLFGESAGKIKEYAQSAYKEAGISANEYMSQVTSFSASLINSLGGDTEKAVKYADMAIKDMSDNANVFGSNIQDIQNAYQGFAKQNYTMLDNLKLGYGGTKEEMARLIEHANELKTQMGETADLSIDSYADVVEAIHLVQEEMGITGTTAAEAQKTISGSIAMMKASWENFMVGLATGNANIPQLVGEVVSSAVTVLENVIPVAKEVLANIPLAITEISPEAGAAAQVVVDVILGAFELLKEGLATALTTLTDIINFISENTGAFTALAVAIGVVAAAILAYNVVAGIKAAMAAAEVASVWGLVTAYAAQAAAMIAAIAPYVLIVAAIAAVVAAIVWCVQNWDLIKAKVAEVWEAIKTTVAAGVDAVVSFFSNLWAGIVSWVSNIYNSVSTWFNNLVASIGAIFTGAVAIVSTAWENIKTAITEKVNAAKETVSTTFEAIKTGISEKLNTAKTAVSTAFENIKTNITTKLNAAKTTVSTAFENIKTGISTKIDAAKTTVSTGFENIKSNITNKLNAAKATVTSVFTSIKSGITEKINGAKDAVGTAIEKLKSFFNFSWSLPPLKLPHISISGKFSLNPISVPRFSISWNALGGVFDSPTIFGFGDSLQGIGEAGAEAVVPLENNLGWLDKLAGMLDERMNKRGNTPVIIEVDGKAFGQASIDTINALTRQRGTLSLNLV